MALKRKEQIKSLFILIIIWFTIEIPVIPIYFHPQLFRDTQQFIISLLVDASVTIIIAVMGISCMMHGIKKRNVLLASISLLVFFLIGIGIWYAIHVLSICI